MRRTPRPRLADDSRAVAWWVLVGAAAGAIAGFLVGGVGGRLAMLALRLTSPDTVVGLTSDDGFEIGVVSAETLQLLLGMAAAGAVNGVAYATLRGVIPRRVRLPLWSLLAAALVGGAVVHSDGVDFTLLEPAALAITLFVLLPGAAAALVVVLVERWVELDPAEHRHLVVALACAAPLATLALLVAVGVGLAALLLRRVHRATALVRPVARVAVPVALVALMVLGAADLVRDVSAIL
jgi:hypothetical protein